MTAIIGVDVGGTFTDVVAVDEGKVVSRKVPTTTNQADGVATGMEGITTDVFLHGTTSATNTLLEERGARVALVTDAGFEDLIEIARQDRPSLYDSSVDRPTPLVPRDLRFSDPRDVTDADIAAISLLDSYLDSTGEEVIAEGMSLPCILSSVVSPEFREYERLATTVLSAYLTPSVAHYLRSLDERLDVSTPLVMTSSGGLIPFSDGAGLAGRLVLSGPAGGVVAAAAVGSHHGHDSIISFDMGGTSTDVCRIVSAGPTVGTGHTVAGRVNRVPSVPIRTIGAGGGSIAWLDDGGALRVGPRSAGADPGPAVYGLGGRHLTVTDANVLTGHIPSNLALGGTVALDVDAGEAEAGRLAAESGLSPDRVVSGVLEVVDAHMERALRAVSVEEGADPRESVLVAFGGAGGLHASRLARRLGIAKVLVPPLSGVFSALGLLLAPPRADSARTVMLEDKTGGLEAVSGSVVEEAKSGFEKMFGRSPSRVTITADMRYRGQSHELEVPAGADWSTLAQRFHDAHRERFGFDRPGEQVEVVNVRATATGEPPLSWGDLPSIESGSEPGDADGVWQRQSLPAGFALDGPAVVVEDNSATLLEEGDQMTVLADGTLEIVV
jgi:N-methylhydantoinase A